MRILGIVGAVWGLAGVLLLLLAAIVRLTPLALQALAMPLSPFQWIMTVAICLFMAYSEGYRGFQLRFSPRTASRIHHLHQRPDLLNTLLAPAYAMGFFRADGRTMATAYGVTTGVILLVVLVQQVAQPWRGIIDAGVVVGLTWGALSLAWSVMRPAAIPAD